MRNRTAEPLPAPRPFPGPRRCMPTLPPGLWGEQTLCLPPEVEQVRVTGVQLVINWRASQGYSLFLLPSPALLGSSMLTAAPPLPSGGRAAPRLPRAMVLTSPGACGLGKSVMVAAAVGTACLRLNGLFKTEEKPLGLLPKRVVCALMRADLIARKGSPTEVYYMHPTDPCVSLSLLYGVILKCTRAAFHRPK